VPGTNPVGANRALIPASIFLSGTAAKEFLEMKKSFTLVLGVLLIFGLVLVSCDSGDKGTAPKVTVTILEVSADGSTLTNNPKSTFAISERMGFRFTFTDPDKDAKGFGYTVKRNGEIWSPRSERDFVQINNGSTSDTSTWTTWGMSYNQAGTFTIEAYAFDMKGNKSATSTVGTFTVQ